MKAILEFNMPEEAVEFELAANGHKWSHAMWDLDQELRKIVKYSETHSQEVKEFAQYIRDMLYRELNERNIGFD
jgi:hypothetical protein